MMLLGNEGWLWKRAAGRLFEDHKEGMMESPEEAQRAETWEVTGSSGGGVMELEEKAQKVKKGERMDSRQAEPLEWADMVQRMEKGKEMDIREAVAEELTDILEIEIDREMDEEGKRAEYLRQIRNPYLYRQGEYVVKVTFADTEATLADRLQEYIEHVVAAGLP